MDVASSSETSLTKPIIPHFARSKNISTVGIMPALKLIQVSDLCVMIYLEKKKKFTILDGVHTCDQQWIPLQGVA